MRGRTLLKIVAPICAIAMFAVGCGSGGTSSSSSDQTQPSADTATNGASSSNPPASESTAAASETTGGSGDLVKVTVGITGLNASHLWAIAAKHEGLMEKAGVDLELVSFQGVSNIIPALLSQSVNFGVLPANGALAAQAKAPNLKLVIGTVVGNASSMVSAPSVKTFDDLKGKKISSNSPGTSSDYFTMRAILEKHNLTENKDYSFVAGGSTSSRVAALVAGAVDALLVQPPDTYRLQEQGFNILSTPEDDAVQGKYLAIAIGANTDWYEKNRDAAVKFARGYQETLNWLFDPANREKAGADFAEEFNVSTELGEKTWDAYFGGPDAYNTSLDRTGAIDPAALQKTVDNGLATGDKLIEGIDVSDINKFIDNSLAEEAAKQG
jgi:NitT/TauT family transport system substrate-binding protein